MIKKGLLIALIFTFVGVVEAQQVSLQSQYMLNDFILNPAVAGTKNYIPINLNFRRQWVGIDGAPVTQTLSAHGYLGKNVGFGGYFFNDVTGPSRRTGMNFSFSYHLKLSQDYSKKFSFGVSAVFFQHIINKDFLTTDQPDDPAIVNGYNNQFCPDANFGMYYSDKDKWYAGVSVFNLLQIRKDLFQLMDKIENPVERTYYFNTGAYFQTGDFMIEPSILFRYQANAPFQVDINTRATYNKLVWLGASYRHQDAMVFMAGVYFDKFRLGYAYDLTLSEVKDYTVGSHEINLVYYIFNENAGSNNGSFSPMFN